MRNDLLTVASIVLASSAFVASLSTNPPIEEQTTVSKAPIQSIILAQEAYKQATGKYFQVKQDSTMSDGRPSKDLFGVDAPEIWEMQSDRGTSYQIIYRTATGSYAFGFGVDADELTVPIQYIEIPTTSPTSTP